jgi:N-acetylglucosamine malate deacetylase 2
MLRIFSRRRLLPVALLVAFVLPVAGAPGARRAVRLLIVVAHPDDELIVAATTYRLAQELGDTVDQFVITNGEGGYRYSTLAEKLYGAKLTTEAVGRSKLPDIRKRELLSAGRILGVRAHYFADEPDRDNTTDPRDVLDGVWNVPRILETLQELLAREHYDFLVTGLPRADLGGHHLAAVQLTLRAAAAFDGHPKPVVLGAYFTAEPYAAPAGSPYGGFSGPPDFDFDRKQSFGFNNALNYQIIANWVIAEHKSQGLYQTNVNRFTNEYFWIYDRDKADNRARAMKLFGTLNLKK